MGFIRFWDGQCFWNTIFSTHFGGKQWCMKCTWTINHQHMPLKKLKSLTKSWKEKLNVSHLQEFTKIWWVLQQNDCQSKLDSKSRQYIFVSIVDSVTISLLSVLFLLSFLSFYVCYQNCAPQYSFICTFFPFLSLTWAYCLFHHASSYLYSVVYKLTDNLHHIVILL